MIQAAYPYEQILPDRYVFVSAGKKLIQKMVKFQPTAQENIINMGFGDVLEDGSISDTINSNNGDMIRVLATVIEILKDHTLNHPNKEIVFAGSTPERTKLYARILKTYYNEFSKDFHISVVTFSDHGIERIAFDTNQNTDYLAFLIKRF